MNYELLIINRKNFFVLCFSLNLGIWSIR